MTWYRQARSPSFLPSFYPSIHTQIHTYTCPSLCPSVSPSIRPSHPPIYPSPHALTGAYCAGTGGTMVTRPPLGPQGALSPPGTHRCHMVQCAQCWNEKALGPVGDQWRSSTRPKESAKDSLWKVLEAEIWRWARSGEERLGRRYWQVQN